MVRTTPLAAGVPDNAQALRRRAEEALKQQLAQEPNLKAPRSVEEMQLVLHELRVHQIELEMQNEELRRAQVEIDATRARYFDLYNLAPLGYCTISEHGLFLEVNLSAATLLGYNRIALTNRPISLSILEEDQNIYYLHKKLLIDTGRLQSCELRMVKGDTTVFWAHLTILATQEPDGAPVHRIVLRDITARKRAEEALRESEQKYRNYITNSPYGVFVADGQGRYLQVNPSACRITGYKEDELLTMSIPDLLFEKTLAEDMAHFHTLVHEGKCQCEIPYRRKNGERRWWSVTAVKISDDHFLGFCNDTTDRKRAEEALRFDKSMLARTEGIAHIGSWEWNVATDKVMWSDELFRIFQRNPEEGSPSFADHSSLYHPDDMQRLKKAVDLAVVEGTPYKLELRAFRKDGEVRDCVAHGFSEKAQDGKVVRLFGSLQDITDSKRMEQNYQMLFREMLDGFALHEIIVDDIGGPVNYRFLAVNPAFERMTGLAAANIIGHTVLDILPDTERRWIETYGKVALTGEPVHLEDYSTALKKYFEVTAFRPAPGQFACVITNVTEKKLAEEEKHQLQIQLQHAQKMEAIGTLAGGIAHDFNNILGAILGYSEMVQEDSPVGSRTRGDIDQVVKASHRAKELVKQILNFSRQTAIEQMPLNPALIVKETVKMLRASLPSTIVLQQDVDPDVGLILADPTQMHQVLVNLCTNAFHAMEATGGTLTISLKKTTLSTKDLAREPQVQPGEFVELSINDTGSHFPHPFCDSSKDLLN